MHNDVKKFIRKQGEILSREEIRNILTGSDEARTGDRLSQRIYSLGGKGSIVALGGGLYFVQCPESPLTPETIYERYYWSIVKKILHTEAGNEAIIGGEKSLELIMRDTSPPDTLILYTPNLSKRIRLTSHLAIHFRTLKTGMKTHQKNAFSLLKRMSERREIDGNMFLTLSLEASLLDTLTVRSHREGIPDTLVLRFLKRYSTSLSADTLAGLTKFRYIRAMNRLRIIAKTGGYERVTTMARDIIKKEGGGCFLTL